LKNQKNYLKIHYITTSKLSQHQKTTSKPHSTPHRHFIHIRRCGATIDVCNDMGMCSIDVCNHMCMCVIDVCSNMGMCIIDVCIMCVCVL